ncbi:MAG: GtrA family protein [Ardenticatenaceae bacterium]|nr:GtrA family protein [Anaerolineales bacterium]MCB8922691.1 GtrA family protein [Ardenticatenaceae bacterium]MCB8991760.1 GtrA family protein [Ardenticatenaceae bacterium]MCB9003601.1 GtrA family protein [Ardenticatenaceae bacterium]
MISIFANLAGRFGMNPKEAERFLKFMVVGTIGFVVDFGTLTLLKETTPLATVVANTISFTLAVISNFTFNRYWTYPDSRSKPLMSQLGQFAVVSTIGLVINNLILVSLEGVFDSWLADWDVLPIRGYIPAKMVATVVVLFWNFFINRYWTYNDVE